MLKKTMFIIIFSFILYDPLFAQDIEYFEEGSKINETYDTQELKDYGFQLYESDEVDIEKLNRLYKTPLHKTSPEDEHFKEEDYSSKAKEEKSPKRKKGKEEIIKGYKIKEDYPFEEDYKRDFIKDYGEEEVKYDHIPMDDIYSYEYYEPDKDKTDYQKYYEPDKDKTNYQKYYESGKNDKYFKLESEENKVYPQERSELDNDKIYQQKYHKPEKTLKTCPAKMYRHKRPIKRELPPKAYEERSKKEKESIVSQKESLSPIIKPSWLFSIPTAFILNENAYRVGLFHADMGMGHNIEIGLHGFKWQLPKNLWGFIPAIGISPFGNYALVSFKPSTPGLYGVFTLNVDTFNIHAGLKILPYWGFIGADFNLTDNLKVIAEGNDGILLGLRYNPSKNWCLGLSVGYANYEGFWKIDINDKESEKAELCVLLDIFYFNKFKE